MDSFQKAIQDLQNKKLHRLSTSKQIKMPEQTTRDKIAETDFQKLHNMYGRQSQRGTLEQDAPM